MSLYSLALLSALIVPAQCPCEPACACSPGAYCSSPQCAPGYAFAPMQGGYYGTPAYYGMASAPYSGCHGGMASYGFSYSSYPQYAGSYGYSYASAPMLPPQYYAAPAYQPAYYSRGISIGVSRCGPGGCCR